jgi:hypothetical protein
MPIITLLPNGAGTDNSGFYVNGAGNHTNLQTDDGDASYVEIQLGFRSVQVEDLPREAAGVNSVAVKSTSRRTGGAFNIVHGIREGANVVSAPQRNIGGGYALYSDSFARPAGGGVWTVSNVNATQPRIAPTSTGLEHLRTTFLALEVDYSVQSGAFVFLLLPFVGPLVAVGLHEIPRLARAFARWTGGRHVIRAGEYREIFNDLWVARRVWCA